VGQTEVGGRNWIRTSRTVSANVRAARSFHQHRNPRHTTAHTKNRRAAGSDRSVAQTVGGIAHGGAGGDTDGLEVTTEGFAITCVKLLLHAKRGNSRPSGVVAFGHELRPSRGRADGVSCGRAIRRRRPTCGRKSRSNSRRMSQLPSTCLCRQQRSSQNPN
jgi:hypothetical protein